MKKIFISGCSDIIHAGHIQFFNEAKALGDHLIVCFASDEVLWEHKNRRTSLPQDHKLAVIRNLEMVDEVVIGGCPEIGLDFKDHFLNLKPDVLAVTEDDQYGSAKRELCARIGAEYHILPKTPPEFSPVSTSSIIRNIRTPAEAPLRVDFGGGWLDVPKYARPGAFIVNCAISPLVSLRDWSYERRSGLGGSGAWALLNGNDGVRSELDLGVGWQDPAIIRETGICIWHSGDKPALHLKRDGDFLKGRMALHYTELPHDTPGNVDKSRDFDLIESAGRLAAEAVEAADISRLAAAIKLSYTSQLGEGMPELPAEKDAIAKKYCGGGWGGYALYLFAQTGERDRFVARDPKRRAIEPYITLR